MMNNDIQIKKLEFDFDITDDKYHNFIFNSISRIVINDLEKILTKLLAKYENLSNSNKLIIDKIEIDLNEIFIQEIDNLTFHLETHLDYKFEEISINIDKFSKGRTFDDLISQYYFNKISPWWFNSKKKIENFYNQENIFNFNNSKSLNILTNDFVFFQKIYKLIPDYKKALFIKNILGSSYSNYSNVLALKKDIINIFRKDIPSKSKDQFIIFSSLKDIFELKSFNLFDNIIKREFSKNNHMISTDTILSNYDQYSNIFNNHPIKFGIKSVNKVDNEYLLTSTVSYFSLLKKKLRPISLKERQLLFGMLPKEISIGIKNESAFINKLFKDKDFFLNYVLSIKDERFIIIISKLSLSDDLMNDFKILFNKINANLIQFEKKFLKYHNTIIFTNESEYFIKLFVRTSLLISFSDNSNFKLNEKDQFSELFHDIARSGKLIKENIIKYLNSKRSINNDIRGLLYSLVNSYGYNQIPEITRANVFYKDMYYYFLKKKSIPFWSEREAISESEVLKFIQILVKRKDLKYLKYLFQDNDIKLYFLNLVKLKPDLFVKVIKILSNDLLDLNEKKYSWILKDKNIFSLIVNQVLENKLWNIKSKSYFDNQILKVISLNNFKIVSDDFISNHLNIKQSSRNDLSYFELLVNSSIHDCITELSFSENFNFKYNSLLEKIIYFLKNNKNELSFYLTFFSSNNINKKFLFILFDFDNCIQIFNLKFQSQSIKELFQIIFKSICNSLKTNKLNFIEVLKFLNSLNVISMHEIFDLIFQNHIKRIGEAYEILNMFYNKKLFSKNYKNFSIDAPTNFKTTEQYSYQLLQVHKFKNNSKGSIFLKKSDHDHLNAQINVYGTKLNEDFLIKKFNILTYYVEFGSFPYDSKNFNLKQLRDIFSSMIKSNIFLVKKHLFNWSKSSSKLDRFLSVIFESKSDSVILNNQFKNTLNIVSSGLYNNLNLHFSIINDLGLFITNSFYSSKKNIFKKKSFFNDFQLNKFTLKKILLKWSKYKFIIKDSSELLLEAFNNDITIPTNDLKYKDVLLKLSIPNLNNQEKVYINFFLKNFNRKISNKTLKVKDLKTQVLKNEIEKGILIFNAGLILFWPFFKTLFIKLNLLNLNKNNYKDEISKDKAVMATDYLVNGLNSSERDFILNKILCGIDVNREIDSTIELVEFEKAICDSAIQALLSNWKKVNSIQTLRDWYLKREARLIENDDSFIIDVQNKPPDVFLKSLSWGISMINYDLMQKRVVVNWKY